MIELLCNILNKINFLEGTKQQKCNNDQINSLPNMNNMGRLVPNNSAL
jgi:hypothetical protein